MRPRPIGLSLILITGTLLAGLTIRFAHIGLPPAVTKFGGSILWALMIYWIVSAFLPRSRISADALLAALIATTIEFLKLYHRPALDAFRLTLPGILLLGRFFSFWDIAAYWLAILAGAFLDSRLRDQLPLRRSRH